MSLVNEACGPQMSPDRWRNAWMSSKLRTSFAKNALAASELQPEAIKAANAKSGLKKRIARIKDETGPSTTIDVVEWFANLVGVEPWELFVPSFNPRQRPKLLMEGGEISGLNKDEAHLIRVLRERGDGQAAALLNWIEAGNKSAAKSGLGESAASPGLDQRASNR